MMFFSRLSLPAILLFSATLSAQPKESPQPKLVVGIVVDQMRNDFIYRYWSRFGANGFRRLVSEGYYFRNAHYNYIPTYTGPGHCSIYTGATPRAHGVIANDWFVKTEGTMTYCAYDPKTEPAGGGDEGRMSPRHQLSSTIGDELRMSSGKSKVFAIAIKDRSAVLPAGHAANGAFWLESATGNFISSSYYTKSLPQWLNEFNGRKLALAYLAKGWQTLYPVETYSASVADENAYEGNKLGKEKPVFPYDFKNAVERNDAGFVKNTPWGNTLTKDLAIACMKAEGLGKDVHTDLLSVSFSSPDIIGHIYGPRSVEIEDVYLRLDRDIAEILNALDAEVGKNNYTVFLTADHGVADVPAHLADNRIPSGFVYESAIRGQLKTYMQQRYGDSLLVLNVSNDQVFLDEARLAGLKSGREEIEQSICDYLTALPGIAEAYPSSVLRNGSFAETDYRSLIQNGYNHKLSGNVAWLAQPNYIDQGKTGTTHGAGYNYDTHVPIIFFGNGVRKGESTERISITQIAPTICELMKVALPNACTARPLNDIIRR